jgi:hypothetical protein
MGLMRFICMRSMAFKLVTKFLLDSRLVFRSLLFIADKMGDLSLQEPMPQEIVGLGIDRFPSTSVRVSLTCEAPLGHGSSKLGESESDLSGDSTDHREVCCPVTADPIYKTCQDLTLMATVRFSWWGQGEPPIDQTEEEIARAAKVEIARAERLA